MLPQAGLRSVYASGEVEPYEFYLSCLLESDKLDLGLGYFSTSAIRTLSIGFAFFIKRGGRMRVIFNNILHEDDRAAILKGQSKDYSSQVNQSLINDIEKLSNTLSKKDQHFYNCLAWLIANDRIEIIATIPKKSKLGVGHQKFGIFSDLANNKVVFSGSINFSQNALLNNLENLTCDTSWDEIPGRSSRVEYFQNLFDKTWEGRSTVAEIVNIDKVRILLKDSFPLKNERQLLEEELELLYELNPEDISDEYKEKVKEYETLLIPEIKKAQAEVAVPILRDYQLEAINAWKENNYVGMLEMATGTGKTFVALGAIHHLWSERKRLFVIISCPFIHLAEQWTDEAKKFGFESILIGESKALWENRAARQAQLYRQGRIDFVLLISTNKSFKSASFQKIISHSIGDCLLVIDEAHYAGSETIRKSLPTECKFRLGLSATPQRHGDEEGTRRLFSYFDKIVYSFLIEQAIGVFLTPYYYHAIPVELTETEFEEYIKLSTQIVRLQNKKDERSQTRLEHLLFMRAKVQNNSINKINWLKDNLKDIPLDYSLFYSGDEIFDQTKFVIGQQLQVPMHEFTSRQTRSERKKLLEDFSAQKIKALVAMKCLDEGVDVPPTRIAFFLASSSNPREFVQRRGRVLRRSPGKDFAILYDLISIPPARYIEEGRSGQNYSSVKSAFRKEYLRALEFSDIARNKYDSMSKLYDIADRLGILDIEKQNTP